MKQILTIILFLFFVFGFSQTPSETEMKTVAVHFYNYLQKTNISVNDIKIKKDHFFSDVLTYSTIVFNNNDWLIISGDKQADPILAYSKEKNYSDFIPPSVKDWLLQYDYYVYDIKNGIKEKDNDSVDYTLLWNELLVNDLLKYSTKATIQVAPLLTTKWGQSTSNTGNDPYAYNYYASSIENNNGVTICDHALAGCPAVAVGQIMKYWQSPDCGIFDWSNMPNTLDVSNPNYDTHKKEIASLLRNIADKMQYDMGTSHNYFGCTGSGTNSVEAILDPSKDDFYYSNATIISKSDYWANAWKDELCSELDNNRPVLYTGYNDNSGHAFVCDGWEKVLLGKKFHFNFGWLGSSDGFYRFYDNYPSDQKAIINIYPTTNCNSNLTVYQWCKDPMLNSQNLFYNPIAGTIHSSPGPIVIADDDVVHYKAYNEIVLENFKTEEGAEFTAEIIPCPLNCNIYTNYKLYSKDLELFTNTDINNNDDNINIYPNPANNILYIEGVFDNSNNNLQIYNSLGSLIISKQITQNITTIDISQLSNGVYFVKILSDNFIYKQKIIKQ